MAAQSAPSLSARALRKLASYRLVGKALHAARPPAYPGLKLTPKRLLNYHVVKLQRSLGHTKLLGKPLTLTLEATNVCNLNCPYCFTGVNEVGRTRSMMSMEQYQRLLDELGDYALAIDFYNWGEPLLNKNIYEMIRLAADRGLSTIISTNFSVPFDRERAEKLVRSGLAALGAGVDGARQESLEQYRVGADFEKVIANLKLLVEAKRALGSDTPAITWSFHVFEHNRHEIEEARAHAAELGIQFEASKGWVAGEEWDPNDEVAFPANTGPSASRCKYLWEYAIVNNDGGVAPCAACFYKEDDFGSAETRSFKSVWNNTAFQTARKLFQSRDVPGGQDLICHQCPYTLAWEHYQRHRARGLPKSTFEPGYTTNDWVNYFFSRKPGVFTMADVPGAVELQPVDAPGRGAS
ncbi:MAG: radical SAM protein [Dehalococcoidia bacterium]